MTEYILVVSPTKEKSENIVVKMKEQEQEDLIKDIAGEYCTETKRVKAITDGQILCGLKWKSKRPSKAIIYGDINQDWFKKRLLPSMERGGEIVYGKLVDD